MDDDNFYDLQDDWKAEIDETLHEIREREKVRATCGIGLYYSLEKTSFQSLTNCSYITTYVTCYVTDRGFGSFLRLASEVVVIAGASFR